MKKRLLLWPYSLIYNYEINYYVVYHKFGNDEQKTWGTAPQVQWNLDPQVSQITQIFKYRGKTNEK